MSVKMCKKCNISKDINDFYNDVTNTYGKYNICKTCKSAYNKSNLLKNRKYHFQYCYQPVLCDICNVKVGRMHLARHKKSIFHKDNLDEVTQTLMLENIKKNINNSKKIVL